LVTRDTNPHAMFGAGVRWRASQPESGDRDNIDEVFCREGQALSLMSRSAWKGIGASSKSSSKPGLPPVLPAEFRPPRPYIRSGRLYQARMRCLGVLAAGSVVNIRERGVDRAQHVVKVVLPGGGAGE
jgi:hypothetical protein